jgi:Na+-translocating ferredoxin:NAD+ oxidoreductase RnfC subunit
MREGRRVPIKSLVRKLHLQAYDLPAPLQAKALEPARIVLRLKQSSGAAAVPVVRTGDRVAPGQVVAEPPGAALGALLHAPFSARVEKLDDRSLVLLRSP